MSDKLREAAKALLVAVEDSQPGWPARLATAMINVRAALAADEVSVPREQIEPVGYISTGTYAWLLRGRGNPGATCGPGTISPNKSDKYSNALYLEYDMLAAHEKEPR